MNKHLYPLYIPLSSREKQIKLRLNGRKKWERWCLVKANTGNKKKSGHCGHLWKTTTPVTTVRRLTWMKGAVSADYCTYKGRSTERLIKKKRRWKAKEHYELALKTLLGSWRRLGGTGKRGVSRQKAEEWGSNKPHCRSRQQWEVLCLGTRMTKRRVAGGAAQLVFRWTLRYPRCTAAPSLGRCWSLSPRRPIGCRPAQ